MCAEVIKILEARFEKDTLVFEDTYNDSLCS